jgi:hypothetical protein
MSNLKDISVLMPLTVIDNYVSSWDLDPETSTVRLVGPKSKEEEYPNYSSEEDRDAKEAARIVDRVIPVGKRPSKPKNKTDEGNKVDDNSKIAKNSGKESEHEKEVYETPEENNEESSNEDREEEEEEEDDAEDSIEGSDSHISGQTSRTKSKSRGKMGNGQTKRHRTSPYVLSNKDNIYTSHDYRRWKKYNRRANFTKSSTRKPITLAAQSEQNRGSKRRKRKRLPSPSSSSSAISSSNSSYSSEDESSEQEQRKPGKPKRVSLPVPRKSKSVRGSKHGNRTTTITSESSRTSEKRDSKSSSKIDEGDPVSFKKGYWKD